VIDEFARTRDIEMRKLEKSAVLGKGSVGSRQVSHVCLKPTQSQRDCLLWLRASSCCDILSSAQYHQAIHTLLSVRLHLACLESQSSGTDPCQPGRTI